MRTIIISVIGIIGFSAMTINVSAQKGVIKAARKIIAQDKEKFQEFANDNKALYDKTSGGFGVGKYEKDYNIKNNYCTVEDYSVPKKVGMLSFYIDDETYSVTNSDAYHITTTTYKASGEEVNLVAQRIFEQSIGGLKEGYAQLGMELLTPDEFLTTDDQKDIYYNTPLDNLDGKADVFKLLGSGSAVPEGFRFLPYATYMIFTGKKFAQEKDAYLKALGLDACVVVAIKLSASGGTLNSITSSFIFKNPGYENSDKVGSYGVGYTPYTASFVTMSFDKPMGGIFIKEEQEFVNKKGKTDIEFVKTDVDPNLAKLVNYVLVERGAKTAITEIPVKEKKKKKKKKK